MRGYRLSLMLASLFLLSFALALSRFLQVSWNPNGDTRLLGICLLLAAIAMLAIWEKR